MLRFILLVSLAFCAPTFGKSIFDDEPQSDSPPQRQLPRKSSLPLPEEPKPSVPPTPEPAPTPSPIDAPRAKDYPAPSPSPADPVAIEPPATKDAVDDPQQKTKQSQDAIAAALNASREYLVAKRHEDEANQRLQIVRKSDDTEQKVKASHEYIEAVSQSKQVRDTVIDKNPIAHAARDFLDSLKAPKPAPPIVQERPQEIIDAIKRRDFIEGMTLQEACKAARIPFNLVWESKREKIYRWTIKGRTGNIITRTRLYVDGQQHTEQDYEYGVLGYVEGRFVDGVLAEYGKFR